VDLSLFEMSMDPESRIPESHSMSELLRKITVLESDSERDEVKLQKSQELPSSSGEEVCSQAPITDERQSPMMQMIANYFKSMPSRLFSRFHS